MTSFCFSPIKKQILSFDKPPSTTKEDIFFSRLVSTARMLIREVFVWAAYNSVMTEEKTRQSKSCILELFSPITVTTVFSARID